MEEKKFKKVRLNREGHRRMRETAEWMRKNFPRTTNLFIKICDRFES